MKRLVALTAIALFAAGPVFAQSAAAQPAPDGASPAPAEPAAPAGDPAVYQVLRPGDRELSCQQLSQEANGLNAKLLADQRDAAKKAERSKAGHAAEGAVAGGTMRAVGRIGINHFAARLGPLGWAAAHAANDAASQATAQAIANSSQDEAGPQVTPEQQRMNHLLGLYKEKSC